MKVSSNTQSYMPQKNAMGIQNLYTQKLSADEAKELREQVKMNANAFTFTSTSVQKNITEPNDDFIAQYKEFQNALKDMGYEGKNIASLSQKEAKELVGEDGFFGIKQTSERMANFVINGAGGDENLMRAGREGMIAGYKMAEDMWGGELPQISQDTMKKALELVDTAMSDLGFSILNQEA
jgi:hypothetical protein